VEKLASLNFYHPEELPHVNQRRMIEALASLPFGWEIGNEVLILPVFIPIPLFDLLEQDEHVHLVSV
jgi:hypothetical protein